MTLAEYARDSARAELAAHGPAPDHVVAEINRALREGGDPNGAASRLVDQVAATA